MHTYKIELRHAPSKNRLNALRNNRLTPIVARMDSDQEAIIWARDELIQLATEHHDDENHRYVEAAVWKLLPIGPNTGGKDSQKVGRWVKSSEGLNWRPVEP